MANISDIKSSRLETNRDLVDVNFEGYRLDGTSAKQFSAALNTRPLRAGCDATHFSFEYLRAYDLHNHLFADPWRSDTVYFVDEEMALVCAAYQPGTGIAMKKLCTLTSGPREGSKPDEICGPSITCLSRHLLVASNGMGSMFLLESASEQPEWSVKSVLHGLWKDQCFTLIGGEEVSTGQALLCMWHVSDNSESKCTSSVAVVAVAKENDDWTVSFLQEMEGPSWPRAAFVDWANQQVAFLTEKPYKAKDTESMDTDAAPSPSEHVGLGQHWPYDWSQDTTGVTLSLSLPPNTKTSSVRWEVTELYIDLHLDDGTVLLPTGQLYAPVKIDGCMWTREGDRIDVHLEKGEDQGSWPQVFLNSPEQPQCGQALASDAAGSTANQGIDSTGLDSRGPSFTQDTEECDFSDAQPLTLFHYRLAQDATAPTLIGLTSMGARDWMFTCSQWESSAAAIGLTYNVDGLLYTPKTADQEHLRLEHSATFDAFAYVAASKADRKFMAANPRAAFVALCDVNYSVFVYHKPLIGSHTASQSLVYLEDGQPIIGFQALEHTVAILCDKNLFMAVVQE